MNCKLPKDFTNLISVFNCSQKNGLHILKCKIMSSHPRIPHPVLEAGTIFYQVGYATATEGIIEHFQEDFIKQGEEEAFQLEQNYNLLNFK